MRKSRSKPSPLPCCKSSTPPPPPRPTRPLQMRRRLSRSRPCRTSHALNRLGSIQTPIYCTLSLIRATPLTILTARRLPVPPPPACVQLELLCKRLCGLPSLTGFWLAARPSTTASLQHVAPNLRGKKWLSCEQGSWASAANQHRPRCVVVMAHRRRRLRRSPAYLLTISTSSTDARQPLMNRCSMACLSARLPKGLTMSPLTPRSHAALASCETLDPVTPVSLLVSGRPLAQRPRALSLFDRLCSAFGARRRCLKSGRQGCSKFYPRRVT
mmetsp:Transcript_955/g.2594  ORF Transcript_955/g.2594 Transcript_955/m.2594 type:complete len:271 (-) Transcript_955:1584-2396(-)